MICQNCHINAANIKITQVFASERQDFFLCIDCAQKFGLEDPFSELPAEFEKFLREIPAFQENNPADRPILVCSGCGHDYEAFENTGLVGCPTCYIDFGDSIKTVLRRFHGSTRQSKANKSILVELLGDEKLTDLQHRLKSALASEDFEAAAILRDEISALKNINRLKP